jgi:SPP1 gp7 family putative phage head morphogenesis protein
MVEAAAHDRTVLDSARLDAGEGRRIYELIEIARESLRRAMSVGALDALSREFAQKVETWQRIQMGKQVRSVLGVDVFAGDPGLAAASEAFTASNVSLIRNLPQRMYDEIETLVQEQVRVGALHKDIAKQIQDRFGIAERRAKLIARDQVGKYYGAVQEQRQKALGVERFIWRTSNDERVRPEHAAREGVEYSWGNPPEGGPGQPVNCRCYAEPVLDDLVG